MACQADEQIPCAEKIHRKPFCDSDEAEHEQQGRDTSAKRHTADAFRAYKNKARRRAGHAICKQRI